MCISKYVIKILSFMLFVDCTLLKENIFHSLTKYENHFNARAKCEALGKTWGLPDGSSNQSHLYSYIQHKKLSSIWLSLKKKSFAKWQWINGVPYSGSVQEAAGETCGAFSIPTKRIMPLNCFQQYVGFICEMPAGKMCPERQYVFSCMELHNKWYLIGCYADHFYHAREHCRDRGGDLAIIDTQEKERAVDMFINEKKLYDKCSDFFIGLHKEEWYIYRPDRNETVPRQSLWGRREAEKRAGDCARLFIRKDAQFWTPAICNGMESTVCQNYGNGTVATYVPTGAASEGQNIERGTPLPTVFGIAVGSAALGITLFALILYLNRKRRKWLRRNRNTGGDKREEEEREALIKKMNDEFPGIKIMIFSNGINKEDTILKNITIIEQGEPFYTSLHHFGTTLVKQIIAGFQDITGIIPKEEDMLVINFKGVDIEGKLPPGTPTNLFNKYMDGKTLVPHVINLCGGHTPTDLYIVKHLIRLRNATICVTPAKVNCTEMPAPEVIAIGDPNYNETMTSGVRDLQWSDPNENNIQDREPITSLETSAAYVCGIITAILWIMKNQGLSFQGPGQECKTAAMRKLLLSMTEKGENGERNFGEIKKEQILSSIAPNILAEQVKEASTKRKALNLQETLPQEREWLRIKVSEPQKIRFLVLGPRVNIKDTGLSKLNIVHKMDTELSLPKMTKPEKVLTAALCLLERRLENLGGHLEETDNSNSFLKCLDVEHVQVVESNDKINWQKLQTALIEINARDDDTFPDMVFIPADKYYEGKGSMEKIVMDEIFKLRQKCVVITNAVAAKGRTTPTAFPADSVICVQGESGQICGATIDMVTEEDENQNPLAAPMFTASIVMLAFLRAKELGLSEDCMKELHATYVMRNVLIELCTHPAYHDPADGYGLLKNWQFLGDDNLAKEIFNFYTGPHAPKNYWFGKTLEVEPLPPSLKV